MSFFVLVVHALCVFLVAGTTKLAGVMQSMSALVKESAPPVPVDDSAATAQMFGDFDQSMSDSLEDQRRFATLQQTAALYVKRRLSQYFNLGRCDRDFSDDCPKGWDSVRVSDTSRLLGPPDTIVTCSPPSSYAGKCTAIKYSISPRVDNERSLKYKRMKQSSHCDAEWPCAVQPVDPMADCPHGYLKDAHGRCTPLSAHNPVCNDVIDLRPLDDQDRLLWSVLCDAQFPILGHS